jgi:VWFA-related protein
MRTRLASLLLITFAARAQDQPVFRTGSRLVQVDVVVRNKSGPVAGLKKEDFTLLDDGKPRPISLFAVTAAGKRAGEAIPLPEGAVSNKWNRLGETPANATIVLIDRLNTPVKDQRYANSKIVQFLQSHGANDRFGIYALGSSLRVIQELTDDPERLARAVKGLKPQDGRRFSADNIDVDSSGDARTDAMLADSLTRMQDFAVADRVGATRDALKAIARHVAKVPGRKNLIWISGSFPLIIIRPHDVIDNGRDVDEAARMLNDANVAVYPVDARGLIGVTAGNAEQGPNSGCKPALGECDIPSPQGVGPTGVDSMNRFAALTGGQAFYNTNGIEDSIRKAVEDSAITYTLGFYPAEETADGKFHKLAVKLDRKGVDIRSRNGYFAAKAGEDPAAPLTVTQLLQDPLDASAVGIAAQASPDAAQSGRYEIRAVIDLHDIHLEHRNGLSSGAVNVSVFVEGSRSARTITRKVEIPDDQLASALTQGLIVTDTVEMAAKTADARVVAQDPATGAAGSVRISLKK